MADVLIPEAGAPIDFWRFMASSSETPRRLWVFLGQSNMVGYNSGRSVLTIDQLLPNIECQDVDDAIVPARYPFPFYLPNSTEYEPLWSIANINVSPAMSFMQSLARTNTEARLVASMGAIGGSSFTGALAARNCASPGSTYKLANNLRDRIVARINSAIGQGCILEGFVWCQGENDAVNLHNAGNTAAQTQAIYSAELIRLIDDLRGGAIINDAFGSHTHKPFLILEMPRTLTGTASSAIPAPTLAPTLPESILFAIEAAKRVVARDVPYCAYVESGGLASEADAIHYTGAAARELGHRAFGAIDRARQNVTSTTTNARQGLPTLPRARYVTVNGRRCEFEFGNNLRGAGFSGAAISDSLGTVVNQLWGGTGVGALFNQALAFDGAHLVSVNLGTGAKVSESAVAVGTGGAPEHCIQVDGLSGVFGDVRLRTTPTAITLERNGAVLFTFALSTGSVENHTSNGPLILRSPNGTRYALRVTNAGVLDITAA